MAEIVSIDNTEGVWGLSSMDEEKRNMLKLDLANKLNKEAISWKQNARETSLKDWDKNTKYFHCLANQQRICNYAEKILIDDIKVEGNAAMRGYHQNILSETIHKGLSP